MDEEQVEQSITALWPDQPSDKSLYKAAVQSSDEE